VRRASGGFPAHVESEAQPAETWYGSCGGRSRAVVVSTAQRRHIFQVCRWRIRL